MTGPPASGLEDEVQLCGAPGSVTFAVSAEVGTYEQYSAVVGDLDVERWSGAGRSGESSRSSSVPAGAPGMTAAPQAGEAQRDRLSCSRGSTRG